MTYNRFANSGDEFGSDGFRNAFQDLDGSPNQARHYVGGFFAGFTGGETLGLAVANGREDKDRIYFTPGPVGIPIPGMLPENNSQKADKALNAVSVKHGADLDDKNIKPSDVADLIRKEVCG